jgi:hypothetical protein
MEESDVQPSVPLASYASAGADGTAPVRIGGVGCAEWLDRDGNSIGCEEQATGEQLQIRSAPGEMRMGLRLRRSFEIAAGIRPIFSISGFSRPE